MRGSQLPGLPVTPEVIIGRAAPRPVTALVEFVTVPKDGETKNGDAAMVRRLDDAGPDGGALIAVIDALGHGEHAADAAAVALRYLAAAPVAGGLRPIVEELHDRLRGTRGAAAMILLVRAHTLEGCGVGNVALRSYRGRVPAMLTPGVLGAGAPLKLLRIFQAELAHGDRLVLHSDGIEGRFDDEATRRVPALETCHAIMKRHRRPHDDATVLVTDFEGVPSPPEAPKGAPPSALSPRTPPNPPQSRS